MVSKNNSYFHKPKSGNLLQHNLNITKIFILALSLFSFSSFFLESMQIFNQANAFASQGQNIQNFNNNLRSNIEKQIQSNLNQAIQPFTNNTSNCNSNDNFVTQYHTSNNGQATVSTNNPSCDKSIPSLPFE